MVTKSNKKIAPTNKSVKRKTVKKLAVKPIKSTIKKIAKSKKPLKKSISIPKSSKVKANLKQSEINKTSLHQSPFYVLGITPRDDRSKIIDKVEELSLTLDPTLCAGFQAALTTPRNRLTSEIAWLPGIAPNLSINFLNQLNERISPLVYEKKLPDLAKANLIAAFLEIMILDENKLDHEDLIYELANVSESIDAKDILKELNADRSLSGFPIINDIELIKEEIKQRNNYYANTIRDFLNILPPKELVNTITKTVNKATYSGYSRAPLLIHAVVDRYEIETKQVLIKEEEVISKLIAEVDSKMKSGRKAIEPLIEKIESVTRNWDFIAQPIQLIHQASGTEHQASVNLALKIRNLSVRIFNLHSGLDDLTYKLTDLIDDLFKEVSKAVEDNKSLLSDIEKINEDKKQREFEEKKYKKEKEKELTYETEIGLVFKDTLKISPNGVEYKGDRIKLEDINAVRWGSVSRTVNGIPTGSDYTIGITSKLNSIVVHTRRLEVYDSVIDRLWKGACVRILFEYYEALKQGKKLTIGGVKFDDDGIYLTKHGFLSKETIYTKWSNVSLSSYNGEFIIRDAKNNKIYVSLPYMHTYNVSILSRLLSLSFENGWNGKLSGYLNAR
jgi:hypothetical protein